MKDTVVVTTLSEFDEYLQHREDLAQIEVINNHIRPFNANKARSLINAIKRNCQPRRKGSTPREIKLRVVRGRVAEEDFSDLSQFIAREFK